MKKEIAVLLHNVRSAHNVGSVFRTADAAGVSKIFLSGYTPCPTDRFGRTQKEIAKTALGAEKFLPWECQKSPFAIILALRNAGWHVVAAEQDPKSIDYRKLKLKKPTLFIFGNEVNGITKSILKKCDTIVEIPMHGAIVRHPHHPRHTKRGKESLNVSVAAGIILFSVR